MLDLLDLDTFVDRYVHLWNDPDADHRRATIEDLWTEDGLNCTLSIEARGHEEIAVRVTRSYDAYVGSGEYEFRLAEDAVSHHDTVRVRWHMIRVANGEVVGAGSEFLVLAPDGRIAADYQFPDS